MIDFLREPKRLAATVAGAAALIAIGFSAPLLMFGVPGSVDAMSTGGIEPAAPTEVLQQTPLPRRLAPPSDLLTLEVPSTIPAQAEPQATPDASPAFVAALEVLEAGEERRAFELARAIGDDAERRAIQWGAIRAGGGSIDYESVIRFAAEAPAFATSTTFKTRLEQALMRAKAAGPDIIRYLGGSMPNTVDAQVSLALAYVEDGQRERAARIARAIWTENFLTKDQENMVHKRLGELLTVADHWDRAVHLMMHDRASGVERLMPFMTDAQKSLAVARNAVSRKSKKAKDLLDAVDASLQDHPVYLFSRAQRARQFDLWADAVEWHNKAPASVPGAAEWWYERRDLIRQLIALKEYKLAYEAAAGYREGPEGRLVEAHFHAGWIALSFLGDAESAAQHFEAMAAQSTLQDSVTQANYWLGRARLALGDDAGAKEAFSEAARYRTVFYGLLALDELGPAPVLRDLPPVAGIEEEFEARDVVRAVRLFAANGSRERALTLLRDVSHDLTDGGELLLAAQLAQQLGATDLAISIAESAERKGYPLDPVSFPDDRVPTTTVAEVDHAAIFAVVRQESRFRTDAVSSAGARGLMQLMPGTARETAARVGVEYSKSRLTSDPAYNALLGSTYLADQLAAFDRSLVLAAAAYNAGPGNARKWIRQLGDPRDEAVDPVVWIELIPYQETRKYVQRVLGNYLVYRARLGREELSMTEALRRIPD